MRNTCVFILSFLIPLFLLSQNNTSIEILGGFETSYRFIYFNNGDNGSTFTPNNPQSIIDDTNDLHKAKIFSHFGLAFNKQLNHSLHLKLGAQFSRFGYTLSLNGPFIFPNQIGPTGYDPSIEPEFNITSFVEVHELQFINIPILLRYELRQEHKLRPIMELGVHPTFFLKYKTKSSINGEPETIYSYNSSDMGENFNLFYLMGSVGFGLQYQLNENVQVYALPNFRLMLNPVLERDLLYTHLYTGGIELGIRKNI